ncbi:hypothetical protein MtrunA17_Chr7g0217601 [Medicago truncatula]|uniref:Transmembrane protein, putative n=1 Tax=Medicago truncatula TaxID=3880 RepID=G7L204_MEDTR|nr:uncharacterized protein LOC11410543 [Medicago truncatula]XP_039683279.1 uncharacterized protein LOC11410543 [Medicago truncatula]AES77467.1 transmembrane protein, putative [Medicago truncatula]RHN44271.1 hypothetical protein MtrunA17_Chr7g0217601 [Medicago truncatula]
MGHSRFLVLLLVSSILFLSFGYGFGRVAMMETIEDKDVSIKGLVEHDRKMREVYEIMDYSLPEPNTNPKSGYTLTPPTPTVTSPPPRA